MYEGTSNWRDVLKFYQHAGKSLDKVFEVLILFEREVDKPLKLDTPDPRLFDNLDML